MFGCNRSRHHLGRYTVEEVVYCRVRMWNRRGATGGGV